jgi:hypothetical protein
MKRLFRGSKSNIKAQKARRAAQEVGKRGASDKAVKDSTMKGGGFRGAGRGWLNWFRGK